MILGKNCIQLTLITTLSILVLTCSPQTKKVLVITGGHSYDTLEFLDVFHSIGGSEFDTLIQPRANQFLSTPDALEYDVFVFYDMWPELSETEKKAYLRLLDKGKGILFLHHALVSYQQWPEFENIIGGKYKQPRFRGDTIDISSYKHDINLSVHVLDAKHPVTKGIKNFTILDEGYKNTSRLETVDPLLGTDNPYSADVIGWAHNYRNSRIVYLALGHDAHAFNNKAFRKLVENAVFWTAESAP